MTARTPTAALLIVALLVVHAAHTMLGLPGVEVIEQSIIAMGASHE